MKTAYLESPIGLLRLSASENALTQIEFVEKVGNPSPLTEILQESLQQLKAYFKGRLQTFELPLQLEGTPFQKAVWAALLEIPYGQTASYKEIAAAIGNPKAVRAVGSANGRNPLPIIIPCHRAIAANGGLGGYSSGLWRKEWLLKHERTHL